MQREEIHNQENKLINLAERFNHRMNLMLVLTLMGMSLGVIGLFVNDIWKLMHGVLEHGIIHLLGTLLMLWVMIELMDTEIEHLKKGKFSINIFIEVVMVAILRDILISTLTHGEFNKQIVLIGAIVALGGVYWLIAHADRLKK